MFWEGVGGPIGGEQLYACCLVIREGVRNKQDTIGHVESLTRQSGVWAYPLFIRVQALPLPCFAACACVPLTTRIPQIDPAPQLKQALGEE